MIKSSYVQKRMSIMDDLKRIRVGAEIKFEQHVDKCPTCNGGECCVDGAHLDAYRIDANRMIHDLVMR